MHRIYRYEVWYRNGGYWCDYCSEKVLAANERIWAYIAVRFKIQLTDFTELPPF